MIHPTRRAAAACGVAVPLAAATAFAWPHHWLFGLAWLGAVAAGFCIDALALLRRRRLEVELRCPKALHVGEEEPIAVVLRGRSSAMDVLLDVLGPALPVPAAQLPIDGGADREVAEVPFTLQPKRRGVIRIPHAWLRCRGPLDLANQTQRHSLDAEVPVLPNIRAVQRQALAFSAADAPLGAKPQHQKGSGTEFEALRDYAPGLDLRTIDWKHSARHRKLLCKEFETERNHHVMLALDTGRLMAEPSGPLANGDPAAGLAKLDDLCTMLLLLAYTSLKIGDRVGFCAFAARPSHYLAPSGGMAVMARMQRAFAAVDYSAEETNFTLALAELGGRLTRRSLVVIATDFADTVAAELMIENVGHLARRHLVVFVAPANEAISQYIGGELDSLAAVARSVVARDLMQQRQAVFARLQRLGVMCLEAPAQSLGAALVNRYLAIKRRDLL